MFGAIYLEYKWDILFFILALFLQILRIVKINKIMKTARILLLFLLLLGGVQTASAKGIFVYHAGPKASVINRLPTDAQIDGEHVNLGVIYEQFGLFWLPVWNYGDTRYVLLSDDEETYWDIDDETLQSVKTDYSLDIPDAPEIPLWQKIGLKPVIILFLLFLVVRRFRKV